MTHLFGKLLGVPSVALRYQNVFGPGQSLQNPYTGILAIFSNLAREGREIQIFEDGRETRDFVYIEDVVSATYDAAFAGIQGCHSFNIGSRQRTTVLEVAQRINEFYGAKSALNISGAFREGDIRHGLAGISRAELLLRYSPQWHFADGLRKFLEWANETEPVGAGYERSLAEMRERGLFHGD
jgi:dTDP-L-rhamnose 4-epimerase